VPCAKSPRATRRKNPKQKSTNLFSVLTDKPKYWLKYGQPANCYTEGQQSSLSGIAISLSTLIVEER
jgi:hypothetical protein